MTWRTLFRWALPTAALALVVGACGDNGVEVPVPGTLTVALTSTATDGAILLTLTGPDLPQPQRANPSFKLYWRLVSSSEMRVMVFGTLSDGPLFTLAVSDVKYTTGYKGTVLQVADRSDALRSDLSGYSLALSTGQAAP